MADKNYTNIHCDIELIKDRSIKVFGDWGGELFIPISVIEDVDSLEEGPEQDINVETWFVEKEGIG